jgi:pilus assembly protein Flp/PilA
MVQVVLGDLTDRVRHQNKERGATAVEYGLMVALIAGVIILTVTALGGKLNGIFSTVTAALP